MNDDIGKKSNNFDMEYILEVLNIGEHVPANIVPNVMQSVH